MNKKSTLRLLHVWIALFAILMNALAPSISHAVAAARGDAAGWEICRADGSRLSAASVAAAAPTAALASFVSVAGDGKDFQLLDNSGAPVKKAAMNMDDCGYCAPHAGSFGLVTAALSGLGLFDNHAAHPLLFYRSPAPLAIWSAARPRGPPALI